MMRKAIAAAVLLLLLAALAGVCTAEEAPATPTDLTEQETVQEPETEPVQEPAPECPHENVSTIIYFFDSPSYTSLSAASHRVSGPGVVAARF